MQRDLAPRVLRTIYRQKMFGAGDRVGVGVSGGADSVALLRLLKDVCEQLGIRLVVLHFNHQLREAESDGDETFVTELAAKLGLDFLAGREDVAAVARQRKWNIEDGARRLRYAFFSAIADSGRVTRVAVAHTADDQAETVLARLVRGTGPAGLSAIYPVKGHIVRPLLEIRRAALREYLERQGQAWREDASNRDPARLRAWLRHNTLPIIERKLAPAIVTHLGRLAGMAREDEAFWSALLAERLGALVCQQSSGAKGATRRRENGNVPRLGIRRADLLDPLSLFRKTGGDEQGDEFGFAPSPDAQLAVTRRLVRGIVEKLRGDCRQLTAQHVEQVVHLATASTSGHRTELPGIVVERSFDWIWFGIAQSSVHATRATNPATVDATIGEEILTPESGIREAFGSVPGANLLEGVSDEDQHNEAETFSCSVELGAVGEDAVVVIPEINCRFRLKVVDWPGMERETKVLDRDLLRSPLVLRSWRPGDSFRPQGRQNVQKLKRLLRTSKISVSERASWPVLTSAGALVWSRGMPVAAEFAAGQFTQTGVVVAEEEI